jgi:DnaJ-class molecular chaperone
MTQMMRVDDWAICSQCKGNGKVMHGQQLPSGLLMPGPIVACPHCRGLGKIRVRRYPVDVQGSPN